MREFHAWNIKLKLIYCYTASDYPVKKLELYLERLVELQVNLNMTNLFECELKLNLQMKVIEFPLRAAQNKEAQALLQYK